EKEIWPSRHVPHDPVRRRTGAPRRACVRVDPGPEWHDPRLLLEVERRSPRHRLPDPELHGDGESAQLEPDRTHGSDRPDGSERGYGSHRPHRPDRTDWPDRSDGRHGSHRPDRPEGRYGLHRPDRPDRTDWPDRSEG